jgi:hypothetical protein
MNNERQSMNDLTAKLGAFSITTEIRKEQVQFINKALATEDECIKSLEKISGKLKIAFEGIAKGSKIMSDSMARLAKNLEDRRSVAVGG